ncbi:MAG: hypothetical protein HWN66_02880 [Candidatus Helarchaeota archaeon]|nr:hypothetical protein [Candidatus Helarchaeota archaeon]
MKSVVNALRVISIVVFIFTLYCLLSIVVFHPWKPVAPELLPGTLDPLPYPFTIGDPEINIWNAFIYFFMYTFKIVGNLFSGGAVSFPFDWAHFWDNYTVSIYYFGFEVCIVVAIVSMVLFLKKCDPKWSFRAFLFLIGMLILVTLTQYAHHLSPAGLATFLPPFLAFLVPIVSIIWKVGFSFFGLLLILLALKNAFKKNSRAIFYFCFAFFILAVSYTSLDLFNTIPSFYLDTLSNSVVNLNFVEFVTNPIFLAAFLTFLFLEVTYLAAYNYEVAKPSLEREHAITEQLQKLEKLGEQSTEQLQARAELHAISIRKFFSSEAFDFMREVIEKGVYDKEAQLRISSLRDYQHLQTYLEELYIRDPEARSSLTAKASLPSAEKLAKASLIGISYRVLLVFVFILLCFSPFLVFDLLAILPGPTTSYLEIQTISAVIVLTIPFVLLFPTIGTILKLRRLPKIEEVEKTKGKVILAERRGVA